MKGGTAVTGNGTALFMTLFVFIAGSVVRAEPYRSSNECRICHKTIFKEWALSAHAHSFSNASFQERYQKMDRPGECLACHAPRPINETGGFERMPIPRKRNKVDGVSCVTCHSAGIHVDGPGGLEQTGLSCGNRAYKSPRQCAPCHGGGCRCFADTNSRHSHQIKDWAGGPYRYSTPCQTCHMPTRRARAAQLRQPHQTIRTIHSHTFPGADNAELVRNALEFSVERRGDELLLSIVNARSGHKFPGSEGRSLVVRLVFLDDDELEVEHRVEYLDAAHGNRLRPSGGKIFSYLLKEGWRRVKVSLLYRYYTEQPERHWLLLHHRIYDLQRKWSTPPSHPIADKLREIRARRRKLWSTPTTVSEWDP